MSTAEKIAFDEFPVRMIGLRSLRDENFVQCRVETSVEHARKITQFILKNGPINEPIVVFDDGHDLFSADGIHRIIGYREAARINPSFKQIRAEIRPGTRRDALEYAAAANQEKTYLKRTRNDIRNAVFMLMDDPKWRLMASNCIAKNVGIDPKIARKHMVAWSVDRGIKLPDLVISADGKTRHNRRRKWARSQVEIPRMNEKKRGDTTSYEIHLDKKAYYLGTDKDESESKLRAILESKEAVLNSYESRQIRRDVLSLGIPDVNPFEETCTILRPGLYGMNCMGIAVTWESFRDRANGLAAIGRAVCCREKIGATRTVVLCPVENGPAEILDLGRKAGIEFMTIEDFVASLKGEAEPQ